MAERQFMDALDTSQTQAGALRFLQAETGALLPAVLDKALKGEP
jgi:hypothetical protein